MPIVPVNRNVMVDKNVIESPKVKINEYKMAL